MSEKKIQSTIMLTESNKKFLRDNEYKNEENFSDCINRLLCIEREKFEKENK